jgi:hypothetical protein
LHRQCVCPKKAICGCAANRFRRIILSCLCIKLSRRAVLSPIHVPSHHPILYFHPTCPPHYSNNWTGGLLLSGWVPKAPALNWPLLAATFVGGIGSMVWYGSECSDVEVVVVWYGTGSKATMAQSGFGEATEMETEWTQSGPWRWRQGNLTEEHRAKIFFPFICHFIFSPVIPSLCTCSFPCSSRVGAL